MTRVDLPEPETPVTQVKTPSGNATSSPLRLCWRGPRTTISPRLVRRSSGSGIERLPERYWPVSDSAIRVDLLRRSLGDDVAAVLAGAGPEVHDVVRGADRALVVFDDDHRVAEVAQALERPDQLGVVALVQADRGLVEDVEDADQARADLRREPDPLRLAAGERRRGAVQREVADPDRVEEGEPLLDLPDDESGDRTLGLGHLQLADPLQRGLRGEGGVLVDAEVADPDRAALRPQACAAALGARPERHDLLDPLPGVVGVGLLVAALEPVEDALVADAVAAAAAVAVPVADRVALVAGAVKQDLPVAVGEILPGGFDVDLVSIGDGLHQPAVVHRR